MAGSKDVIDRVRRLNPVPVQTGHGTDYVIQLTPVDHAAIVARVDELTTAIRHFRAPASMDRIGLTITFPVADGGSCIVTSLEMSKEFLERSRDDWSVAAAVVREVLAAIAAARKEQGL